MSILVVKLILFTTLLENYSSGKKLGGDKSSILSPQEETLSGIPVKKEDLPMWKQVIETVMNDVDNLDDVIYQDDDGGDESFDDDGMKKDEKVDCYGLPEAISKILRFLFSKDETVHAKFYISTRRQPEPTQVSDNLNKIDFNPQRRTIFIVHGFMSTGKMQWVKDLTAALLGRMDANVFAVDWSEGGNSWMYWKAVANTRVAGEEIRAFIRRLMALGLSTKDIHMIGHSLGAHICSYVGSHMGGIGRITGLDPAQLCFQENIRDIRLDPSDAEFIDVIHTNGRSLVELGLGLPEPIGHVDFYPNGGAKQPGCSKKSKSILFPLYDIIRNRIEKAICSHGRSYTFFIESVKLADRCLFWGHRWDRNDTGADEAILAPCNASNCTEMGIETEMFPARGSFYVPTTDKNPYCVKDSKTDSEMAKFLSKLYRRAERINQRLTIN